MQEESYTKYLLPGERVVWSGKPGQGFLLAGRDIFMIPFSLLWCGFAIFWETMVFRSPHTPAFFKLWGVPFILAGLYLVFGRFLFDAFLRRRIDYALTDRRILILGPKPFASIQALPIDKLVDLSLREGRNGRGTLAFGPPPPATGPNAVWTPSLDKQPKFIDIENAVALFRRIQGMTHR